jgi:hypothetical protein
VNIAWDPLFLAAITAVVTVLLYLYGHAPRVAGFTAAATVLFLTVSVRPLLALAHHPVTSAAELLIIAAGAVGAGWLFWLIVFRGHHKHPLVKKKGPAGAAPPGGGGAGGGKSKGAHHRAMSVTVAAMVFTFLLVSNWPQIAHMGRGGFSQTINGITQ